MREGGREGQVSVEKEERERASERGKQRQLKRRGFNSIIITGRCPRWD